MYDRQFSNLSASTGNSLLDFLLDFSYRVCYEELNCSQNISATSSLRMSESLDILCEPDKVGLFESCGYLSRNKIFDYCAYTPRTSLRTGRRRTRRSFIWPREHNVRGSWYIRLEETGGEMVRTYKRSTARSLEKKKAVHNVQATQAVVECSSSVRAAAAHFDIPYETLRRNLSTERLRRSYAEHHMQDSLPAKKTIGHPALYVVVNNIKHPWGESRIEGKKRHPNLALRKPEGDSKARAAGVNKDARGRKWFTYEQPTGESHCIAPEGKREVTSASLERRENVRIVAACNAGGHFIHPIVIFKGIRYRQEYCQNMPSGTIVKMSECGYINEEIFFSWLQHFNAFKVLGKCLLVLDGHSSHCSLECSEFCEQHNIELICLPPYTTHVLQPLDITYIRAGNVHTLPPEVEHESSSAEDDPCEVSVNCEDDDTPCSFCGLRYNSVESIKKGDWIACQQCSHWYYEVCVGAVEKTILYSFAFCSCGSFVNGARTYCVGQRSYKHEEGTTDYYNKQRRSSASASGVTTVYHDICTLSYKEQHTPVEGVGEFAESSEAISSSRLWAWFSAFILSLPDYFSKHQTREYPHDIIMTLLAISRFLEHRPRTLRMCSVAPNQVVSKGW
ncbi:hypothetical protein PR048_006771 [Dryococelus australis]|uniref:DDE-1 domain-containing protein n=1 Tax=Dryococelus australis TaxID=614101 RepID=A0ABQ9IBX2_9NEOP|nr:hypothetical protein PR048_006771 [Dryococelus australis]